jgi:hypothetical protein
MKKQVVRISILQSSKIITAIQFLVGFIYTLIGIPMFIFGDPLLRNMGVVYLFMPVIAPILGFIVFIIIAAIYNFLSMNVSVPERVSPYNLQFFVYGALADYKLSGLTRFQPNIRLRWELRRDRPI